MGELLRFPDRGLADPSTGSGQRGVEQGSAPSGRAARSTHPAAQQTLEDLERLAGPDARQRAEDGARRASAQQPDEAEPGWAVPGVDDSAAPAPEPTRRSQRAENVALAALTRHDASEGEIRAKLVAKGLEEQDVEAELERLRGVQLIDDTAFATRLVDRLRERKGLGDQGIRSALRGRLVPQDVIEAVLAEQAEDEETAEARLQEVADDRARRLGSLPADVAERRLIAYLMRKGYSGGAVRAAARTALGAAGFR